MMMVIFLGFATAKGGAVYAEQSADGRHYGNFVYSAEFAPQDGASRAGFVFGADEKSHWTAVALFSEDSVALYRQEEKEIELKKAGYDFKDGEKLKMTLVVNEGVAKLFIGDGVASLTYKLDGYTGGTIDTVGDGFEISNTSIIETDTPDGNIYIGGYSVLKVVNLTDGNYKLDGAKEYSVKGGVLTISESYLKTLEADTEYSFRVVTSFTDFNFKVNTDFTSVTATPSIEKYYRNNDVTIELSSASVTVHKLLIDGKVFEFTQTADRVVISSKQISTLSIGKHSVKLYTDKGRPETTFNLSETVETVTEPAVKSTHMWLWIDVAIFLSAIVGYVAFSIISKRKKK